jgi:Tat protein secretion system quality control protein TatD with DNase activity
MTMLIDTHCHLDAAEFEADRDAVIARAQASAVAGIVIPSVARGNFDTVRKLAHSVQGGVYALGIHPLCVPQATEADLDVLEAEVQASMDDPRFVAIGEIGLDFFIPALKEPDMAARQTRFYTASLILPGATACLCCCMCGARRIRYSSSSGSGLRLWVSRMLSMAVSSKRKALCIRVLCLGLAAP